MANRLVYGAEFMAVSYGTIASIAQQQKDTSSAQRGGAVMGGLVGLFSGKGKSNSTKALRSLGGATIGTAASRIASQGIVMSYHVNLVEGGAIRVVMENTGFHQGDCVAVETGNTANMRRVSDAFCRPEAEIPQQFKQEHILEATECDAAKSELINAADEAAVKVAVLKLELLCED